MPPQMPQPAPRAPNAPSPVEAGSVSLDPQSLAFQQAVAQQVEAKMASMKGDLLASIQAGMVQGVPSGAGGEDIIRRLASAIAEMNDLNAPASAPIRLSPELAASRAQAKEEMVDILMSFRAGGARHNQDWPKYVATAKLYMDERVIEPFRMDPMSRRMVSVEFQWIGEPNDAMRPKNEIAEEIYALFQRSRAGIVRKDPGIVEKKYWVTDKGLVVAGEGPKNREIKNLPEGEQLKIGGEYHPDAEFINVLGTVQEPARQGAQPKAMGRF